MKQHYCYQASARIFLDIFSKKTVLLVCNCPVMDTTYMAKEQRKIRNEEATGDMHEYSTLKEISAIASEMKL